MRELAVGDKVKKKFRDGIRTRRGHGKPGLSGDSRTEEMRMGDERDENSWPDASPARVPARVTEDT